MRFTPRQEDAQLRIHALLAELVEIIGPRGDGETEFEPGDAPVGQLTLREWATVGCWIDDDGNDFMTVLPGAGMLPHHVTGLLNQAGLAYSCPAPD